MADDNKVEVKFGAQTSEIEAGAKKASDAVKGATDTMKGSLDGMKSSISGFHSDIKGHFDSLTNTIGKFQTAFLAIGAVIAGGALFKGAVDEFLKMNSAAKTLSVIMNTSIGDSQAFLESYKRVGVEGETVTRSMIKLVSALRTNEDAFTRNKIVVRGVGDELLPLNEIWFNTIARLKAMEGQTGQTMLASELLGRNMKEMPGLLKNTIEKVEEMRVRLASLGITLDDVSAAKAKKYKEGMYDVELVSRALKYKIGEELIPVLIQLAHFFADVGPPAIKAFGTAFQSIQEFMGKIGIIVLSLITGFQQLVDVMGILGRAVKDIAHGILNDFSEVSPAVDRAYKEMEESSARWKRQATADANSVRFSIMNAMQAQATPKGFIFMPGAEPAKGPPPPKERPEEEYVSKGGGGGKGGGGMAQQWQAELDQMKLTSKVFQSQTLETEKAFRAKMLALGRDATREEEAALKAAEKAAEVARLLAEQNFWKSKLAAGEGGVKEQDQLNHKVAQLELQINKVRLQEEIDLIKAKALAGKEALKDKEALIAHEGKLEHIGIEMKKADIAHMAKLGNISRKEEARSYELLLKEKHAGDLKREKEVLAGYKNDIKAFKAHQKEMELTAKGRILEAQKAEQTTAEASSGIWGDVASGIGGAFTGALSAMTQAGATFGSIMAGIGQSLLSVFTSIIGKIVQEWLAGLVATLVGTKTTDALKVLSLAGVAGAGGFASVMATVPFPANIALAPAIAASAFGQTMAYGAAEGGWDVPGDAMALLHKNEMVLPASLADNVRNMTGGGGAKVNVTFAPNINHRMTQSEWHAESAKMLKAINRQLSRFGKAPLGPSYA